MAAVVLSEADVSSSVQTLKSTSPVQVGLSLLGLEARGKLGAESLVTIYGGTHSLDIARVRRFPLPAEGDLVLEPGDFRAEITGSENIVRKIEACTWIVIFGEWRIVHRIWNRLGRTGHESLLGRPWLGIGGELGEISHMYMGESLSEPSAGRWSLVLSKGWGDRAFLHFPCSLFPSSLRKI